MLDLFKKVSDTFDALFFVPMDDDETEIYIQTSEYKNKGELIDSTEIGPTWHIVLFKHDGKKISDLDSFEGIFSDPREYVSGLISSGWYGVVAKKTTTSEKFIKNALDSFQQLA